MQRVNEIVLAAKSDGWSVAETANFRVYYQEDQELADKVVETAERAPTGAGLAAWRLESTPRGRVDARRPASDAAPESGSTVKPAAANPAPRASEAETPLIEDVAIHERSAAGDEDVVVEDDAVAMPVASPVVKPPAESSEEADVEGRERDARSGDEQPRIPIPSRPGDDGRSVHHPRVVFR